jgi:hypothetical protein
MAQRGAHRPEEAAMNDKRAKRLRRLAEGVTEKLKLSVPNRYQINQRTRVVRLSPACQRGAYQTLKRQHEANELRRAYP